MSESSNHTVQVGGKSFSIIRLGAMDPNIYYLLIWLKPYHSNFLSRNWIRNTCRPSILVCLFGALLKNMIVLELCQYPKVGKCLLIQKFSLGKLRNGCPICLFFHRPNLLFLVPAAEGCWRHHSRVLVAPHSSGQRLTWHR